MFRRLAVQKESRTEEGHLTSDYVHMVIAIPPKYAVSQVIGYIKGKSAIHLARAGETGCGSSDGRNAAECAIGCTHPRTIVERLASTSRRSPANALHADGDRHADVNGVIILILESWLLRPSTLRIARLSS